MQLTKRETLFCVLALCGVVPTIDTESQTETIRVNILAYSKYSDMPETLPAKLEKMTFNEVLNLYSKIHRYWDVDGVIDNPKARLTEVGLFEGDCAKVNLLLELI
jgi:hypothetical protein